MNRKEIIEKFKILNLSIEKIEYESNYYNFNKIELVSLILKYIKNSKLRNYCELILKNLKEGVLHSEFIVIYLEKYDPEYSFSRLVTDSFTWENTPEGDLFWVEIYDDLDCSSYNILELIYSINLSIYPDE